MGAWSHEPFGNDTAADWAYGLTENSDLSYIEAALEKILDMGSDYIEAPDAEEAVAAVEVIAKLLGRGTQSDAYTKEIDAWVQDSKHKPNAALLQKAQRVLDRILSDDSELLELWEESDQSSAWKASMEQLKSAIST